MLNKFIIALLLGLSLAACNKDEQATEASTEAPAAEATTEAPAEGSSESSSQE